MSPSIEWISVETLQAQTLSGLEILGQNPQLQSIRITEASPAMISEVSKLPVLEELELVFPKNRVVDLAPLGKVSTLKSLDVLASSSIDYRWASSLKHLEELEVSTYGKERVELKIGETVHINPVLTVEGTALTPRENPGHNTERRLTGITATRVTARKAGVGNLIVDYTSQEEPIPGMPNLRSARYHSTWQFGIRDTATFTPIGLAQNPSLEGHGAAVVGDLLLAPVSNYPFTSLQWTRNGQAIPGATGESYRLAAKDANAAIAVDYSTKPVLESSVYLPRSIVTTTHQAAVLDHMPSKVLQARHADGGTREY